MTDDPKILDEKHPSIAPTIEKLAQINFPTPDYLNIVDRVSTLHEAVTVRKDSGRPFGPFNRLPTACLAVVAPTFHGKTYSIHRTLDELAPVVAGDGSPITPKILRYKCAPNANVSSFLNGLLRHAGYPANRDLPPGAAASRIAPQFQAEQYTLFHIDEFQWALNPTNSPGRSREHDENLVWNTLHSIVDNTEWPTLAVVSGLPAIIDSLNRDTAERAAIRSRFDVMSMSSLTIANAADVLDVVVAYCEDAAVSLAVGPAFDLGKRLTHASNYTFGIALQLARLAVARAILRPERTLTETDFVDAYAVKMNCRQQANPFYADDWRQIDPTLVMAQTVDQRRAVTPKQQGR